MVNYIVWDYDTSSCNYDAVAGVNNPCGIYAGEQNIWYNKLLEVDEFRSLVAQLLKDNINSLIDVCDSILNVSNLEKNSFERNFNRWNILNIHVWPNTPEEDSIHTWEGQVEFLKNWLLKSIDYLYNYYVDGSEEAYSISFNSDELFNINIINNSGNRYIVNNNAWSRDENTGELLKDGNGQLTFEVIVSEGYKIKNITISNSTDYDSLDIIDEDNHIYQIKGIKGDIVVTVELEEDTTDPIITGYNASFVTSNCTIMVYSGKDYTIDGEITDSTLITDMTGDGQLNFKVIFSEGYELDSISVTPTTNYKALKDSSDTGVENVYRVTKIKGDIIITVTTKEIE